MRYSYEIEGVIDADSEEEAEKLAARLCNLSLTRYGWAGYMDAPKAILATCDVAVVTPKKAVTA